MSANSKHASRMRQNQPGQWTIRCFPSPSATHFREEDTLTIRVTSQESQLSTTSSTIINYNSPNLTSPYLLQSNITEKIMTMAPLSSMHVFVVAIIGLHLLTGGAAAFVLGCNRSIIDRNIRCEETALLFSFQQPQRPPPRRALKKVWMMFHFYYDLVLSLSLDITDTSILHPSLNPSNTSYSQR